MTGGRGVLAALGIAFVLAGSAAGQAAVPPAADSVFELEELRVAVDSRLPGDARTRTVTVLDRATLEALPAVTVEEALRWAVGIDLQPRSAAQADVSVRGGTFEQVLVLVDGIPVSDAQTGHFDLDLTVPLARVERIEVLRGAGSSVHGADAMGGVINVVTRGPGSTPSGHLQVEGGSFGRYAGTLGGGAGFGAWSGSATARLDRSDGHREGVDHDLRVVDLRLAGPLAAGRLRIAGGWAARDFGADGFYAPFPSYEETRARTLSARWARTTGGALLDVAVHGREHDDDFVLRRGDPAFYRNVHESRQWGGDVTLRSTGAGAWGWAAGLTGGRDDLESTNLGDRSADRGAVFGEMGWSGDGARVRAGLRLDAREGFAPAWAPSVSAGWAPGPSVGFRAALARSHRTPTWTDRYYEDPANLGNPDLAVETAWSGEAGIDWTPPSGLRVRVTGFVREARDLIDWARPVGAGDGARWETRNVESATFRGLEVELGGVRLGSVALDGSAEWLRVTSTDQGGYVSRYALRPLVRTLHLGARLPLPGGAAAGVRIENRQRTGEADWTAADLRLEAPLGVGRAWLDVTNVGDATWLDASGLAAPGRAVRAGVTVTWGGGR